ncbi:hypothetical protein [Accumulibacter sp.]|uniref:hypothetical protein n=1 Tax=Accumulibacter sp. TaxID=2053492 RepID=UPI0025EDAAC8|nr:hypothetical protein [Accumulibacter sp.]MCM8612029.1 hypothetical protein [Accumulibacter sp.]MCM8637618.1 hypothetical protein [Accumulibacter sp.]MCM8639645.1 hypothetical protein [Accumulibacter sp.]
MLAERSVRRLSIRAPDAALARRGAFLIEDALRTASLPGDGGELVLLRRLQLPPFAAAASPQQVAAQLARACRAAAAIDGAQASDAALAAATAVRFADALTAHLALTRLILARAARAAWCWPLLVTGYHPALDGGSALRSVALSLAALPEAPAALPRWLALLLAHGEDACARLLLALAPADPGLLDAACGAAVVPSSAAPPQAWRAALDWSWRRLGGDDPRHLWLARMARRSGLESDRLPVEPTLAGAAAAIEPVAASRPAGEAVTATTRPAEDATVPPAAATSAAAAPVGPDRRAVAAGVAGSGQPRRPLPPVATGRAASVSAAAGDTGDEPDFAAAAHRQQPSADAAGCAALAGSAPATGTLRRRPAVTGQRALAPPPATASPTAGQTFAGNVAGGEGVVQREPTTAGGLLFLVPLLCRLAFADWLAGDAGRRDMPQRILVMLLRRLPVDGDDPIWCLFAPAPAADVSADREAARWLGDCRRHLRRRVGIGLHSLVCRPARLSLTPTHVDVWQDLEAVDLRLRRAGLDLDPGWVPWLGRVLCFHYGRGDR